jgi:uncharacterized protein YkwD
MRSAWRVLILLPLAILCAVVLSSSYGRVTLAQQGSRTVYLPLVMKQPAPPPVTFADRVIELVNQERANNGCPALAKNTALMNAAQGHSTDMALNDFVSHTGSDGSSPGTRATRAGYNWSAWGENIAAGYSSPESVVQGWMDSPGHRANILNCGYRDTGVGYYYLANDPGNVTYHYYWTQMFGTSW